MFNQIRQSLGVNVVTNINDYISDIESLKNRYAKYSLFQLCLDIRMTLFSPCTELSSDIQNGLWHKEFFSTCSYSQYISRGIPCGECCNLPLDAFFFLLSSCLCFEELDKKGIHAESWVKLEGKCWHSWDHSQFARANQQGKQFAISLINETNRNSIGLLNTNSYHFHTQLVVTEFCLTYYYFFNSLLLFSQTP